MQCIGLEQVTRLDTSINGNQRLLLELVGGSASDRFRQLFEV